MKFKVWGLEFRVRGLGSGVGGFGVWSLGLLVLGVEFRIWDAGTRA